MHRLLLAYFLLMILLRILWFLNYVLQSLRKGAPKRKLFSRMVVDLLEGVDKSAEHEKAIQATQRQSDLCLLSGTISFAAWTALIATRNAAPTSAISDFSLNLLAASASALIIGPAIARSDGAYMTYMIRESALYVGLGTLALSLCGVFFDLGHKISPPVLIVAASAIVVRDALDFIEQHKLLKILKYPESHAATQPTV